MRERYTEVVETAPELRYFDASPEARAAITEQLRAALAERPEIRLAYLLGSFAEARPFRDIDVAVYLEPEFLQGVDPLHYCFQLADVLERVVGYPVDVHRLNDAPCGFRFSATCGRVLLSRDEAFRLEWTERTWHEYAEFEPYRRMYLQVWLHPFREKYEQHTKTTDANRRTAR
jgi:predicted nucleotidyltransferase